jgi:hypothetical protein
MRRVGVVFAALVAAAVLLSSSHASAAPTPSNQDFAIGSHEAVGSFFYFRFEFSARSGSSGEAPSGDFFLEFGETGRPPTFKIDGPVTCLAVEGNAAVIGIASSVGGGPGNATVVVHDAAGTQADPQDVIGFFTVGGPTGPTCPAPSSLPPLFPCCDNFWGSQFLGFLGAEGTEITVRDAPRLPTTKPECKNGGWKTYGIFKNQGDCVSFVATGGKNPPGKETG